MSEENTPDIEEIKASIEIPVEEDDISDLKAGEKTSDPDVSEELKHLGRQFAETFQSMWNSEERMRVESEIREGLHSFVDEVDKVIRQARSSETSEKISNEASHMKQRAESSDLGVKAREGIVQGLHWLSTEFGKLADQFTPVEKSPEDVADTPVEDSDSGTV